MECPEFLPLGSIVIVRGSTKKIMVISRGLVLAQDEGMRYYDYGACLYPEGLMGDTLVYFNHEGIQRVVHEGYADDENGLVLENLARSLKYVEVEKGNPAPLEKPQREN